MFLRFLFPNHIERVKLLSLKALTLKALFLGVGSTAMIAVALADQPKYRIGVLAPLTGNFANYGKTIRQGIEAVQNPSIEWVFEDEACEPSKAVSAYKKLSSLDKISFFIGPCCGSPQKAIAPLLYNQDQVVLLPNAASSEVFDLSARKMYSVQYSLEADATFIADEMNKRGLKKVAVIYVDNDFSQTLETGFLKFFQGKLVYSMRASTFDVQNMKAAALKLKNVDFDSIFIPDAAPLLLGFLSEMNKMGIPPRPTFSVYAAQMPDVLVSEKANAESLIYSYPDVPDNVEAFGYFPSVAAKLMADTVVGCKGQYDCVAEGFMNNKKFQSDGTLRGNITLKTVRNGHFVRLVEK